MSTKEDKNTKESSAQIQSESKSKKLSPAKMSGDKGARRAGRRPGRRPAKIDIRSKLERSRQSARECRARKKLRYQYLEDLVVNREKAVFMLRQELETYKKWCVQLDAGLMPHALQQIATLAKRKHCLKENPREMVCREEIQSYDDMTEVKTSALDIHSVPSSDLVAVPSDFNVYQRLSQSYRNTNTKIERSKSISTSSSISKLSTHSNNLSALSQTPSSELFTSAKEFLVPSRTTTTQTFIPGMEPLAELSLPFAEMYTPGIEMGHHLSNPTGYVFTTGAQCFTSVTASPSSEAVNQDLDSVISSDLSRTKTFSGMEHLLPSANAQSGSLSSSSSMGPSSCYSASSASSSKSDSQKTDNDYGDGLDLLQIDDNFITSHPEYYFDCKSGTTDQDEAVNSNQSIFLLEADSNNCEIDAFLKHDGIYSAGIVDNVSSISLSEQQSIANSNLLISRNQYIEEILSNNNCLEGILAYHDHSYTQINFGHDGHGHSRKDSSSLELNRTDQKSLNPVELPRLICHLDRLDIKAIEPKNTKEMTTNLHINEKIAIPEILPVFSQNGYRKSSWPNVCESYNEREKFNMLKRSLSCSETSKNGHSLLRKLLSK